MTAGARGFLKLSRFILEIQCWILVRMSQNCNFSSSGAELQAGLKLKKAHETLHAPITEEKRRRKHIFLWPLSAVMMLSIGFLLSSYDMTSGTKENTFVVKAQTFLQHFNVSKNQLHSLTSLFSESDQTVSIKYIKDSRSCMPQKDGVSCDLRPLRSEEQALEDQDKRVLYNGQCPVYDEKLSTCFDQSYSKNKSVSFAPQSSISVHTNYQLCGKRIWHLSALGTLQNFAKEHCQSLCSLVKGCMWVLLGVIIYQKMSGFQLKLGWVHYQKLIKRQHVQQHPPVNQQLMLPQKKQQRDAQKPRKGAGRWRKKLLLIFVCLGVTTSIWLFWHLNNKINLRREVTLVSMCDERARMLQDQFNVSLNHVHALALLVSTFHHGKLPSAMDQKTFGEYTERTAFERPLTSGVAYALKVSHSEREQFEKKHGWTVKKMEADDQTLVQDCIPENLDPAPIQDEYAPVIFSQETVSHIVSIDMMSGKEDRENILRARSSGKGVLTSPFKLLKSNHLGVVLTFAVYNTDLPTDATPQQRIEATAGYLGASYDVPSLVEKLLHQLASKQTIVVDVYDTTNVSGSIKMYGSDVTDTGLLHISSLDFGDPLRKHEMHCRFKRQPPLPWTAINASVGVLVITLLVGHIFHAAISRIAKVENDYREMMELKVRAEAADVAKSQFLATVSHEIRTPMNGVLGMLKMLMDTNLDENQLDYAQTAHESGKGLISLINKVLDQAKIESGRLELECVAFDLRSVLDNVLSLFSSKSNKKGTELAVYVSNLVPEVVIGDPERFRQIIMNLVGNSIKFIREKGHIFVSVHLADEVRHPLDVKDKVLRQSLSLIRETSNHSYNTLTGLPVVDRWKSWEQFKKFRTDTTGQPDMIRLLFTIEDTGDGIPLHAQSRIFTPFMQADSSTSRTYGGTGIGLSISKCLVDLMDGEIGFMSELGIGSTFSFTGSFQKGEIGSLDAKWQQYDSSVSEFRGLRALIIDCSSIRSEVTKYHLQRLGISTDTAFSQESVYQYLSNTRSRSVSTHLAMILIDKDVWDKEGGLKLHHSLREHVKSNSDEVDLPKIFLLATSVSANERNELKSAGLANNLLMKPLRLSVLSGCFQEALGSGKMRQVNRKKQSTLGTLLRGKKFLVVDDNVVNRRVAEGALKKYGAIVTCVESGRAALSKLEPPHKFDACFMDIQMPEMDGFEATRQVRCLESKVNEKIASGEATIEMFGNMAYWHTPIVAMTADVIQATNEKCMKCGMDDYISKPFEEEQLYSAVARYFESG